MIARAAPAPEETTRVTEGAPAMELTLRYSGLLPSNGGTKEKQNIRLHLHEQLEFLWAEDRRLREIYKDLKNLQIPTRSGPHFEVVRPISGPKSFWWLRRLRRVLTLPSLPAAQDRQERPALPEGRKAGRPYPGTQTRNSTAHSRTAA